MQCVSVAERILYRLQSVMFVKLFEDGDIFVYSWYICVQLNAAVRNWNKMPYMLGSALLCYHYLVYVADGNGGDGCHDHIHFWLLLASCSFLFLCCNAVVNTPTYSGVTPFLSLLFSLSLSFLNWLAEYQEPNFSHPLATVFPISCLMQQYCLCLLPAMNLRW